MLLLFIFYLSVGLIGVLPVKADIVKNTAAGDVTWNYDSDDITEVTLDRGSSTHGDGYDHAMKVDITGTVNSVMDFHFSDTYGMVVQEVEITNSGTSSTTYDIRSWGDLGSDGSTEWHYVDNNGPYYSISSDKSSVSTNGGDPVISFLYGDNSVNNYGSSRTITYSDGNDDHDFEIQNVNIDAGETQRYLFLGGAGDIDDNTYNRPDQAYNCVSTLVNPDNWPKDFTGFLTANEKNQVINWNLLSGDYVFINCGATGRTGPTQSDVDSAYSGTNLEGDVTINTQGIQEWTVPETGTYRITAGGAEGGTQTYDGGYDGGRGAIICGDFSLNSGETIHILVGQKGEDTRLSVDNAAPGGGGGTFVYKDSSDTYPLIAAGGGGSGARCISAGTQDASFGTSGYRSGSCDNGGSNGNGGISNEGGSSYWAGGGTGWLTDGTGGNNPTNYDYNPGGQGAEGGRAPRNGGYGGVRHNDGSDEGGDGGFGGGGGGGSDNMGGGGGGGYSGGGGARYDECGNEPGGGGGSYNSGSNPQNIGYNTGPGYVTITFLGSSNSAPDSPTNPIPSDGATSISTSPTLSVDVSDPDGDSLDVTFYDDSDDSVIGADSGVADGGTASVSWSGLSSNTGYSWYTIADDGSDSTQSSSWSFTTANNPPSASFSITSSSPYYEDEEISFDASASSDTDGSITSYEWDWTNDGSYDDEGVTITHTFLNSGTYTVTLRVTDDNGVTDTYSEEMVIGEAIILAEEKIQNDTEEVSPETDEWSVNISHNVGGTFQWWINTTPDIGSAYGVSSDPYEIGTCEFHDLQPYTTYTVHVTVRGSDHEQNYTFTTGGFSTNTSWHNSSTLNVTVEHEYPRILWYDIQKYTGVKTENDQQLPASTSEGDWVSVRNNMTEVDNATWLRVVLNVSSDQGWENIEFINISGWHDNGSDGDGSGYNRSGNHGSNRNFFLCYDNTSDGTAYYNKSWPKGSVEVTKGNMTERNVSDPLGISTTETRNLSFQFKPGYQFRYAPGPDGMGNTWMNHSVVNTEGYPSTDGAKFDYYTTCWEALNNSWSWNLNISITNKGMRGDESVSDYSSGFTSWVLDEFGVYSYTEIVSAGGDVSIHGAPGGNYSTNSSNPFNSESENVSLQTRSNGNYSLSLRIDDLLHNAASGLGYDRNSAPDHLILENDTIWVRGGTRSSRLNFSDELSRWWISLYGSCNDETGVATGFEAHEVNGTSKFAGETADDNENTGCLYPNDYNETMDAGNGLRAYNGLNSVSHYVEFTCDIPLGAWAGKYSTHVYYHLQTEHI